MYKASASTFVFRTLRRVFLRPAGPSILVGDPARAVMGDYEGDASSERHHDRAAQCRSTPKRKPQG